MIPRLLAAGLFIMLVLLPIAAFFVPEKFTHVFGILPTHWVLQCVQNATQGLSVGVALAVGYLFFVVLTVGVAKVFVKRHFM